MTEKDREDALHAMRAGADFIALSYVRAGSDLDELRHMIAEHNSPAQTCAKIETEEALSAIEEIIERSDFLMIARGDLGLHVRLERVPILQKQLIRKCAMAGKSVITATQMLESMVHSPRPTRAEASDVANAIFDGSDAVMLSAETAIGAHPIAAVKTMSRIADEADRLCDRKARRAETLSQLRKIGVTRAMAFAAVEISEQMGAAAILATTTSGQTARWMSQARPKAPVLAVAWSEAVARQLSVVWGVQALVLPRPATTDEAVRDAMMAFRELGKVRPGQQVVVTAGAPPGITDRTNLVTVQTIP
jgi:pyruvate kinase